MSITRRNKETEILLGMHLNHNSDCNTDRMYSPKNLKLINDFAVKEIKKMAQKKHKSKPNSPQNKKIVQSKSAEKA